MIKPEDVIGAVRAYMEDAADAIPLLGGTKSRDAGGGGKRKKKHMRAYWNQLAQIVPDDAVEVWKQLESNCKDYKEILERRAKAVNEVDSLAEKNNELKKKLNQMLGDRKNDYFQVPPAQTMRIITSDKTKGAKKLMSKTG